MSRSLAEIEDLMAAAKDQKKAVKGNQEQESYWTSQLKALSLEKAAMSTSKGAIKKFTLKVPKGTRDFNDKEMAARECMFRKITTVFKRHGAATIDTPVFELKELLSGKYGEDSKLIYDLEDQGGELCSLRYDLTVPFARFLAMNRDYANFKRYHIGKVYRRDQPSVNKGRMREFYQCDFDIAGVYDSMIPDSEAVRVMVEILDSLPVGPYLIKMNHRKVLDGMFQVCGVPDDKIRAISSAVDKLDKAPWDQVRKEMTEEKGLDPAAADKIEEFVKMKGGAGLCDLLLAHPELSKSETAMCGVREMKLLFTYLELFGVDKKISFDLSLARGLDYYTDSEECSGVGSIAAGGRYDNLVGMFSGGAQIPCVGVSIGVERVFALITQHLKKQADSVPSETQVYVCAIDGLLKERMAICRELWSSNIKAEFMFKGNPKLARQLAHCEKANIKLAIILGQSELDRGIVKIKDLTTKVEVECPSNEMIAQITARIENTAAFEIF